MELNDQAAPAETGGLKKITAEDVLRVLGQVEKSFHERIYKVEARLRTLEDPRNYQFDWELERLLELRGRNTSPTCGSTMPTESFASRLRRARGE